MKDGIVKLATDEGDETLRGANVTAPAFTALRDALSCPPAGSTRAATAAVWSRRYL
jgi:hypothetical protein